MTELTVKKLYLLFVVVCLLLTAAAAHAHTIPMGASRWVVGKHGVTANIDLNLGLMNDIGGIKDGKCDIAKCTDNELRQIASEIIQPYLNRDLTVSVNGRTCPVKVDKLSRADGNLLFTIWLTVDGAAFDKPENSLKIDYRLLFEETNHTHVNMAFLYETDATGAALQKVFNFSPPKGEFNFQYGSTAWETSVKGPLTAPAASRAKTASRPVAADKEVGKTVSPALSSPVKHPADTAGGPAKKDPASKKTAPVITSAPPVKHDSPGRDAVSRQVPPTPVQVTGAGENADAPSIWANIGMFIQLGIEHILTGYDHIAFLIGLIVIGLSFREVLKIITAFTIAHSITLLLAAMQVISLNSRFVESVIAFSICYIAVENLFRKKVKYRWVITFCFGLVHGFGFASALQDLIVGKSNLLVSVVSFNFGVELGQLMIFFLLLPVLYLLRQKMEFRKVTAGVSVAIFIFGFSWLIERLFDVTLIS